MNEINSVTCIPNWCIFLMFRIPGWNSLANQVHRQFIRSIQRSRFVENISTGFCNDAVREPHENVLKSRVWRRSLYPWMLLNAAFGQLPSPGSEVGNVVFVNFFLSFLFVILLLHIHVHLHLWMFFFDQTHLGSYKF